MHQCLTFTVSYSVLWMLCVLQREYTSGLFQFTLDKREMLQYYLRGAQWKGHDNNEPTGTRFFFNLFNHPGSLADDRQPPVPEGLSYQ